MSELALKLITENIEKHNRGEDASFLDLGNCEMVEIPKEIGKCVWLKKLTFSEYSNNYGEQKIQYKTKNSGKKNNISSLPKEIVNLINLKQLWLHGWGGERIELEDISLISELVNLEQLDVFQTSIHDLTPLSCLSHLKYLSIGDTNITNISPLSVLKNLTELDIHGGLITDISPLSSLIKLKKLHIAGQKNLKDIIPIKNLKNLSFLGLQGNPIMDFQPISFLTNLNAIYLHHTPIKDLTPLSNLKKLSLIILNKTEITSLEPIRVLKNLSAIFLDHTLVNDIEPISKIKSLEFISCCGSPIKDLSPLSFKIKKNFPVKWQSMEEYFSSQDGSTLNYGILVKDCPLNIPPIEFVQESPQAVKEYFEELGETGKNINEVKIIFLGEASAGKTSLVKRLINEKFDSKESQTHGIRIRKMSFDMDNGDEVITRIWDFGGQEVMHATHQFFLSQRSIYVLLLNSRNDDQAEKWLKYSTSFGGHSPVLVVLNKIDENPSFEVNRKALKEKYPHIRDFFRISAKTEAGIAEFKATLKHEVDRSDTRQTPFPAHWLKVKEHFSNMEVDYIDATEYKRICRNYGVLNNFSQDVLLQFMHDLGILINFNNLKYFDTQILNPLWLTNGVYRIINSELIAKSGGILREKDLHLIMNDSRYNISNTQEIDYHYPENKLLYIVRVMQEFELCFQLNAQTYIIPQLLPVQEPDFLPEGPMLQFLIQFPEIMPDSIFPRLMVKLHTFINKECHWRTGMVLQKETIFNALARVRWDKEDKSILIEVCGEERRRFLSFIRETVKEIIVDFADLQFKELVPIPNSKEFLEYEGLVEAEKAGEKELFIWQVKKKLLVGDLLDGVEEPMMRDATDQLPVKAFISYSFQDAEYLKELRSALAPLVRLQRLQIWDDRDINAGEEWESVLFQQLGEADIVICLVSADFVASDFCYKNEFGIALKAHDKGEKVIVPILLRKTDWQDLPLAAIQGSPTKWITSCSNRDEAWTEVSQSLRPALDLIKKRKKILLEKRGLG